MTENIKIEIRGVRELQSLFREAPRKVRREMSQWLEEVAEAEAEYIRREAPSRTGKFRQTIVSFADFPIAGIIIKPYPRLGLKLAHWILEGTPAHMIYARRAAALRFYWKKKRRIVFFRRVYHPGKMPNDFISRGVEKFDKRMRGWYRKLEQRIENLLK